MAQISIVRTSDLEGATRLDAEYYKTDYQHVVDAIANHRLKPIGQLGDVLRGRTPKSYNESGTPVIRAVDLRDITNEEKLFFTEEEDLFFLHKGDVLISSIGAGSIGKVGVFNSDKKYATVSEVSVVRLSTYLPEVLCAFLQTKYGYFQIERRVTGSTGQLHLYPKDIVTIKVPLFNQSLQKTIENLYKRSTDELKRSRSTYNQAQQAVLDEVGFNRLDLPHQSFYSVSVGNANAAGRLDAEHFQPKYMRLIEHLKKSDRVRLLGDLATEQIRRGVQPEYVENGEVIALNSRYVGFQFIDVDKAERTSEEFWQSNKRGQADYLDVVMNSTGWGTIGRSNCILHDQRTVVDNHVSIIKPDLSICDPIYISVYLNSEIGLMQTNKWLTGSSGQVELYPAAISNFVIHLPDMKFQKEIADLVRQAYAARQKANALIEQAIKKVENFIEGKA